MKRKMSSSLLTHYQVLNEFLDSNLIEKSLEIYSSMIKSEHLIKDFPKNFCLEKKLKEFFEEQQTSKCVDQMEELKKILSNPLIFSLICTFDSLMKTFFLKKKIRPEKKNRVSPTKLIPFSFLID